MVRFANNEKLQKNEKFDINDSLLNVEFNELSHDNAWILSNEFSEVVHILHCSLLLLNVALVVIEHELHKSLNKALWQFWDTCAKSLKLELEAKKEKLDKLA